MTVDLQRILRSKRLHRERLAAQSIGDRLRILDALREREISIRRGIVRSVPAVSAVRESAASPSKTAG